MDRPSPGEIHKREHERVAANARELGDKALKRLDAVLREQEDWWEEQSRLTGCDVMNRDELLAAMWYEREIDVPPNPYV
jgi:hypothetical protein